MPPPEKTQDEQEPEAIMVAGDPRSPQRGSGRGYSGYDRYGNYDPRGHLLPSAAGIAEVDDVDYADAGLADIDFDPRAPRGARGATGPAGRRGAGADDLQATHVGGDSGASRAGSLDRPDGFDRYDAPRASRSRTATAVPDAAALDAHESPRRSRNAGASTAPGASTPDQPLLAAAPAWTAPAALVLGPLLGVLTGQALGAYAGPGFAVVAVLSAMLAAASVARRALWWVVPAAPPLIWLTAVGAELVLHDPAYQGTKAEAVGLAHGTAHAFPVMAAALAAALLVAAASRLVTGGDRPGTARTNPRKASHA